LNTGNNQGCVLEAKAVKFLWKRKHFVERSWKRKQTRKHLTFWGAGSGRIFHKILGRDVEAEAGSENWKRCKWLNFCGNGSTLKKEARSGSKFGSD